jgi:hypothetical protein
VLLARAHKACAELGRELGREIEVRGQHGLHQEQFEVTALDSGPPVSVPLQWLGFPPEPGDETASTAELQLEAAEPSSAAAPDTTGPADAAAPDITGPADAASDEPEPAPTQPELAAPPENAEEVMDEPAAALAPVPAESAREPAPREPTSAVASPEQASGKSTPAKATSKRSSREPSPAEASPEQASREPSPAEAAPEPASREPSPAEAGLEAEPPEDDSTAEPTIAASAGASESEKRFAAPTPAVEMLDLEPETPILPHPAKVKEP